MIRAIIIDDEEPAIEMMKVLTGRYPELVKVVASSTDPERGLELIEDYRPDLVFLDISMPRMNGFEFLSKLSYRDFKLVFTTAHQEHAIEAIKNRAFDYLLKPVDTDELRRCLENVANETKSRPGAEATSPLLEIQVKDGIIYIKQQDIIRVEASGSYSTLYLNNGVKHVASKNLKEFESRLDPTVFYRCHNSHIINLQKVQKFVNRDGFFALMSDGSLAHISKNHKDTFIEKLKQI